MDLDTVIINSLQKLIDYAFCFASSSSSHLATLRADLLQSEGRACGLNSSIIVFRSSQFIASLYLYLVENYTRITRVVYKFDHYLEMMLSDNGSCGLNCVYLQDVIPKCIIDYPEAEAYFENTISECDVPAIVCFPLQPKPHEVKDVDWVEQHWTQFYK